MKDKITKASYEYEMGYDAGYNGSNTDNCHFSIFSTKEKTKEWERGNKDGQFAKSQKQKLNPTNQE